MNSLLQLRDWIWTASQNRKPELGKLIRTANLNLKSLSERQTWTPTDNQHSKLDFRQLFRIKILNEQTLTTLTAKLNMNYKYEHLIKTEQPEHEWTDARFSAYHIKKQEINDKFINKFSSSKHFSKYEPCSMTFWSLWGLPSGCWSPPSSRSVAPSAPAS